MTDSVTGVRPDSENDGSHLIEITRQNGVKLEATIPTHFVQEFLRKLQWAVIRGIFSRSQQQDQPTTESVNHLQEWTVTAVHRAHRNRVTNLSIVTLQVGMFVLVGEDAVFRQMRDEIDSILKDRAASRLH